jgi:hypothetical protein
MVWLMDSDDVEIEMAKAKEYYKETRECEPDLVVVNPKFDGVGDFSKKFVCENEILIGTRDIKKIPNSNNPDWHKKLMDAGRKRGKK